jgi:hypothetical protein
MTSDYPYGIFTLFFYLISDTMTLGGVDIYLTNLTTVYLPVYGVPVLLSLTVYVLMILFFKKWTVDREVLVLHPRHNTLRNEVEQPLIRTRLRSRRLTRFRPNRRRSHLDESTSINFEASHLVESISIHFEAELDKPYGKALKEFYSDEQIKRALIYMNQKGKCNT